MSVISRNTRWIAGVLAVVAVLSIAPAAYADCQSEFEYCMNGMALRVFLAALVGLAGVEGTFDEIGACYVERYICLESGEGEQ